MGRTARTAKAKGRAAPRAGTKRRKPASSGRRPLSQRLAEALAQNAAIGEVLQVISASPDDVQPVLDAVAERAARLCAAPFARVLLVDGDLLRTMARYSLDRTRQARTVSAPATRASINGRAVVDRTTVHHADVVPLLESEYPEAQQNALRLGFRAVLSVPLMREGNAYGAIFLWRRTAGPFSPEQVALVETFAQQAAIAIDSVRLFRATREALEQQTATSEILRVISQSPTDVQPVFDTIAAAALKLCNASSAIVFTVDGDLLHVSAVVAVSAEGAAAVRRTYPRPIGRDNAASRAVLTRGVVAIPDVLEDPEYAPRATALAAGFRSVLSVPLMREGTPIGAISVGRPEPGPFPDAQVALLQTFADQAVIAIENVRLFKELGVRNRDLTEALEQQTATSDILRAISQSPTDVQPVFDTIAAAALKLCNANSANVFTFDGELIHLVPLANANPGYTEALRGVFPRPPGRDTAVARAVLTRNVVMMPDVLDDPEYAIKSAAIAGGFRSNLGVPLLRDGIPIGAIAVGRAEPGPFPDSQIALLQTFADQAVIAIENVRLFTELEARNRDLTEALEQQTATSEILRVISQSPTDVQPVFDTIAAAALKLCNASSALVTTFDGELVRLGALAKLRPEGADGIRAAFPRPPSHETGATRAILLGSTVEIPDVLEDPEYATRIQALAGDFRSVLAIPLMRKGSPIGAISVGGPDPGFFPAKQKALLQTFADQAVIAIENVRLFTELDARNRDLTEALEQQTATSDILRVISQSPTDVQPVFETITTAALRLCSAASANLFTFDGRLIHLAAYARLKSVPEDAADAFGMRTNFPRPPGRELAAPRAVLECSVVSIPDVLADPEYGFKEFAVAGGFRSVLAVPLVRENAPVGAIVVGRPEPGPFPASQIALLQTFADQAVIAIENVRLFTELDARNRDLTEALERQTATSGILRVISQSPRDVQPVFDTIAERSATLCGAKFAFVTTFDGEWIHMRATHGVGSEEHRANYPIRPGRDALAARVVHDHMAVQIPDFFDDPDYAHKDSARKMGYRSGFGVPMTREGQTLGVIAITRDEPGVFPDKQIALLQTFADQAVIAIENVRLFTELEARNRDLTEALEQQTATSDILRVISRSQTDVQPVFDTIAAAALKLCRASSVVVTTYDGELLRPAALANVSPEGAEAVRQRYPRRPGRENAAARAVLTRSMIMIPDVLEDSDYDIKMPLIDAGFRSVLAVPLMREESPIGVITAARPEPGPFPDKQIALLRTFADQAVIAIENVRLFTELEARTAELLKSVEELRALGEVGQAVSSTLDLETVLRTIVSRATALAGVEGGAIFEYDEAREEFRLHATDKLPAELVAALGAAPVKKGVGAIGRLAVTGEPVQIEDIVDERSYQSHVREILIRTGSRSLLAVPLLREDRLLGGLVVNRRAAGEFTPEVIELLQTFATQSALAIQNARLYREIEVKSRELELASRHKSEFLANMSHELRTPLNAIIGFSEVLSQRMFGEINDKQAEYVGDILDSGRHLLALINDILDLSKIEAGRMELEPSDFELPAAIENTLILVRERAQRREIALEHTVDERLGTIRGDERKVKQVLLNLLSNALKFTPEGGRIDVRADVRDGMAEIAVQDTGVGIAPEDQQAVFEEFRQVGTASKKVEGTGLGLAISRKFVELHGGRIWVTSEPGKGSTFCFTLPLS